MFIGHHGGALASISSLTRHLSKKQPSESREKIVSFRLTKKSFMIHQTGCKNVMSNATFWQMVVHFEEDQSISNVVMFSMSSIVTQYFSDLKATSLVRVFIRGLGELSIIAVVKLAVLSA